MSDRCATAELLDEAISIIHECRIMSLHNPTTRRRLEAFAKKVAKYEDPDMIYRDGDFIPEPPRYECEPNP